MNYFYFLVTFLVKVKKYIKKQKNKCEVLLFLKLRFTFIATKINGFDFTLFWGLKERLRCNVITRLALRLNRGSYTNWTIFVHEFVRVHESNRFNVGDVSQTNARQWSQRNSNHRKLRLPVYEHGFICSRFWKTFWRQTSECDCCWNRTNAFGLSKRGTAIDVCLEFILQSGSGIVFAKFLHTPNGSFCTSFFKIVHYMFGFKKIL